MNDGAPKNGNGDESPNGDILRAVDVTKSFGGLVAVSEIDFSGIVKETSLTATSPPKIFDAPCTTMRGWSVMSSAPSSRRRRRCPP